MIYEWMYPENLFRVIMLAVNTPGHFVWDAQIIDAQIQEYAGLCALDPDCSARTDDLAETMRQVSRNMPDRWLFVPIDEDTVNLFTLVMFFESIQPPGDPIGVYGPAAADLWLAAAEGDASGMALVSMMRNMFLPNYFTWGHLLAIGGGTDEYADPARDYSAEFEASGTILGSPLSLLILGMGTKWPTTTIPEEYLQLQPSDVETLLVAGSIDFMTPPQGADELMPYLNNGRRVYLEEFGHGNTFWNSQPEARLHLLNTFFDSGEVDSSLYVYQPLEFDVGRGWPGLAKLLLGIVLVLLILLAAFGWFIVRTVRRRRARSAKGKQEFTRGESA
jgi:pimeloyl-ACP methyl ester carboxylesterase